MVRLTRTGKGCSLNTTAKCCVRTNERGFTYIALLILIAILGVALAADGEVWSEAAKREKEQELLFIGQQFRDAITSYYNHTPAQAPRYPAMLEDLLKDPRYPATRRYLRKIYYDPFTNSTEWGLVKGAKGEIMGVYSTSEDEPLKQGNFSYADRDFEGKTKYSEWVFMVAIGRNGTPNGGTGGVPSAALQQNSGQGGAQQSAGGNQAGPIKAF